MSRSRRQPPPAPPPPSPSGWLVWGALLIVTLAAYYPAWHGAPVWDDDAHLTRVDLRSLAGLGRIWFDIGATQQYYPVVHSAFWAMHRMFGDATLGYHIVTIAIHATSAFLAFVLLTRLAAPGALLAAAIFALHPVHVESVAWMTELKNTLSGLWYLLAVLAYLRFDASRSRAAYAMALAVFVLALLSKTVTASWPAAVLVILWWQRGRLRWRDDVAPLVPFFILGLAGGLMTMWVERTFVGASGAPFELGLVERILIAGRAIWFYLASLAWPVDLSFIYPRWQLSASVWWQYLYPVGVLTALVWLWRLRTRSRAPLTAALFFIGTLVPALGFFNVYPFVYSFVADHFQYLASLGPIALAAGWVSTISRRKAPVAVVAVIVLVLLGTLTWRQAVTYADAETLYRATIATSPTSWMAHINLGKLLQDRAGRPPSDRRLLEAALAEFDAAIAVAPGVAPAHNNRGAVLEALGRTGDAINAYRQALSLTPDDAAVRGNLSLALTQAGTVLMREGRLEDAIGPLDEAARLTPRLARAHYHLANALEGLGRHAEAVEAYRETIKYQPEFAEAFNELGIALAELGRYPEAAEAFTGALRVRPDFADARENLARVSKLIKEPRTGPAPPARTRPSS